MKKFLLSGLLLQAEVQTLHAVCWKEERKEITATILPLKQLNVPLENQLVIEYNKTLVIDMLEWEKALVSVSFDLIIELSFKQKM